MTQTPPHGTASSAPPTGELTGKVVAGKYQLIRLLGQGGMGAVYEAKNQVTLKRVAVKLLFDRADIDAVVTLGAVIEGETDHDQVVMNQAARKLTDLSVEYGKPLGLGISGPGETRLQAQDRIENAANAVRAVVKMAERVRELRG